MWTIGIQLEKAAYPFLLRQERTEEKEIFGNVGEAVMAKPPEEHGPFHHDH